jgi:uncharacterized protein (TIGR04222 family)
VLQAAAPFDLQSVGFLGVYVAFALSGFAAAAVLRSLARRRARRAAVWAVSDLASYELAYLAGGPKRVVEAVAASLVHRGAATVDVTSRRLVAADPPPDLDALEHAAHRSLLGAPYGGAGLADLQRSLRDELRDMATLLERSGLIFSRSQTVRWMVVALLAPAIGVLAVLVGVILQAPVAWLGILCVGSIAAALRLFGAVPQRTVAGEALLEGLRKNRPSLPPEVGTSRMSGLIPVSEAVALLGVGILADTSLAPVTLLSAPPRRTHVGGNGGESGSGDGGDGCGGGGCGGGCGGGGCGGE